jgi:hypothetical protein
MNAIDVFLATQQLRGAEPEITDGELYIVEYDSDHKFLSKTHISRHKIYGRIYKGIQGCCKSRIENPKWGFVCDTRCGGVCIPYLLSKVYDMIYNTPPSIAPVPPPITVVKPSSPKSSILEESLDELFEEDEETVAATAPTKIIATNPLDGAVMAFGKYKGRTFKDAFDLDKGYCLWCIESSAIKQFVEPHKKPLQNMILFVHYAKQKFTS